MIPKPRRAALVVTSLALLAGAAVPGQAGAAPQAPPQCFSTSRVSNYAAVDDRHVNVRVGVRDVYELQFLNRCPDVDWSRRIGISGRGSGSICAGKAFATVVVSDGLRPRRCEVTAARKLTPEEVAALPPRQRP